jgi:hypothetical protein
MAMMRSASRGGVGKLEAGRGEHLDVHRHPQEVGERHAPERGAAGTEEVLVHGIGEEEIGPLRIPGRPAGELAQMIAGALRRAPGREGRQPPIGADAFERRHLHLALEAGEKVRVVEQEKGTEWLLRGHHPAVEPGIGSYRGLVGDEGEEAGRLVAPEEQGIPVEGKRNRRQFSMLRWRCRRSISRRATA